MQRSKQAARVAAALAALVLLAPGAARAGIADGLVASYPFDDGTPRDASGTGNDGVAVGDVAYAAGFRGTGLKLAGVRSPGYVFAEASDSLAFLDDYTFALWFRIDGTFSMDGYGQLNDDGHHTLFAKAGDTSGLDIRTWRSQENGLLDILAFDGRCCGLPAGWVETEYVIGVGEWHHAAFTSGGGGVRLYLDGVLVDAMSTVDFMLNPAMASQPLLLGIDTGAMWYPLDGMLDEVRVYRRALAPEEVAHLAARWAFGGFLPPLASDGSTAVRSGNNLSVKFQLADAAGELVTNATALLTYAEVLDAAGTLGPAVAPADGGTFRYDAAVGQYVYNLSTRTLAVGKTYELAVALDDGSTHTARLALR